MPALPALIAAVPAQKVGEAVVELVLWVPDSAEPLSACPQQRAQAIAHAAARKASLLSGSLAFPPGFMGWLTVLPELMGVWRLQAQMVADIAALYGVHQQLGREQLLYCLFKQVAAQLLRDVAVRVGERTVLQPLTLKALQSLAQQLGLHVTRSMLSKSAARWVPLLGAVGVGAYAYYDTLQVARTAQALFAQQSIIEENGH